MRLFGKIDGSISRFDRAVWLTPPFDKMLAPVSTRALYHVALEKRQFLPRVEYRTFEVVTEAQRFLLESENREFDVRLETRQLLPERDNLSVKRAAIAGNSLLDNLIAYWPSDEASGSLLDVHINGLDLADVNTVTNNPGKAYTTARQYTAANNEYHTRDSEALLQIGDIDFTLAAWVYFDGKSALQTIVSKDSTNFGTRRYALAYVGAVDRIHFIVHVNEFVAKDVEADNLGSPSTDTWYFVIAWHDATSDRIYIQVDNGTPNEADVGGALRAGSDDKFRIGGRDHTFNQFVWDGRIGPTMFWKSAAGNGGVLTVEQRTALWNTGAGLTYSQFDGGSVATGGLLTVNQETRTFEV